MRAARSQLAMDALLCVYQHRLMSTSQLHRLPGTGFGADNVPAP